MADEPGGATPADGEFASYDEIEPAPSSSNVAVAPPDDAYDTYEMPTAATTGVHHRMHPLTSATQNNLAHKRVLFSRAAWDQDARESDRLATLIRLAQHHAYCTVQGQRRTTTPPMQVPHCTYSHCRPFVAQWVDSNNSERVRRCALWTRCPTTGIIGILLLPGLLRYTAGDDDADADATGTGADASTGDETDEETIDI